MRLVCNDRYEHSLFQFATFETVFLLVMILFAEVNLVLCQPSIGREMFA